MKDVESNTGHQFYRELSKNLRQKSKLVGEARVHKLVLALLYSYRNRPALRWQFTQWLTDKEKAEYESRRNEPTTQYKKHNSPDQDEPTAQCTKCNSTSIKAIVYGLPINGMNKAKYIYAGCIISGRRYKYGCDNCGERYMIKPPRKKL